MCVCVCVWWFTRMGKKLRRANICLSSTHLGSVFVRCCWCRLKIRTNTINHALASFATTLTPKVDCNCSELYRPLR